jgi:hypothetical protein
MYIYYCWVTALLPNYQDGIIAGMAKLGYMVGPAAKDGKIALVKENCPSVLIALSVYKAEEEVDANKIYKDIEAVLTDMNARYYSVIVSLSHEAAWVGSNFSIPVKKKVEPPPPPPSKKGDVN